MAWRIHPDSKKLLDDMGITSIFGAPQTQQAANPPRPVSVKDKAPPPAAPKAATQTSLVHTMEFEDVAGAHAVIVQSPETGAIIVEEIPQGGQLAMQGVSAGDKLVKVDGREVSGNTPLKLVKALVEGKPGSPVELEMERWDDREQKRVTFPVNVIRTLTVSEDVQIGTYDELERLLDNDFDFTPAVSDQSDRGVPAKEAHDRVCQKLVAIKRGRPVPVMAAPAPSGPADADGRVRQLRGELDRMRQDAQRREHENERVIRDLRHTITERDAAYSRLREDFLTHQAQESVALSVSLREDFDTKVPPGSRAEYEKRIAADIAQAIGADPARVEVVGLHKGSVNVDMSIHPAREGGQPTSRDLAQQLARQVSDPASNLRRSDTCRNAAKTEIKSPSEWISRLKRTSDQLQREKELLTDDCQGMAEELAIVRGHKDQRTEMLLSKQRELETELERLRTELDAQSQARKAQVQTLSQHKEEEEQKLNETVARLHNELSAQDQRLREQQTQLQQALSELEIAKSEVARLQGETERQRNTIETLQADALMASVRHQEVLSLTERALDDANGTIEAQRQELNELSNLKGQLASSEEALKGQLMSTEQLKARHSQQLELTVKSIEVQLQKDKAELERKHQTERDEFVLHLENAEETVRTLRSELETRLIAQNELVRKLATQEELVRNIGSQHGARDEQMRKLRADNDIMATSMEALERELRKEQNERQMLLGENRQLKVEENTWKRVEKMKLLQDVDGLREENRVLKERVMAVDGQLMAGMPSAAQSQMAMPAGQQQAPPQQQQMLMRSSELSKQQAAKLAERLAMLEQELDDKNQELVHLANKATDQQRSIDGLQQALRDKHRAPSGAEARTSLLASEGGDKHDRLQSRVLELETLLQEKESERARAAMEAESWRNAASLTDDRANLPLADNNHARPFSFF